MQDIENLREITYELTTICGANCVMCARNQFSKPGQNMTMDEAMTYTDKALNSGYNAIILGGMGDPLAYPHICEFLSIVKDEYPQVSIRLTTTGQLLDEKKLACICEHVDILKISNYGFTKPVYEAVHRGSLVFEKVQENLMRLVEWKGRRPYVIMSYLDMDINHREVLPWVEYWTQQGMDEVNVWKAHNWGGHTAKRENISEQETYCARVKNRHFKVWADGTVSVCTFDCDRTLVIGDLKTEDFDVIESRYQAIKSIHDQGGVARNCISCSVCDQIYDRTPAMLYLNENGIVIKDVIHK